MKSLKLVDPTGQSVRLRERLLLSVAGSSGGTSVCTVAKYLQCTQKNPLAFSGSKHMVKTRAGAHNGQLSPCVGSERGFGVGEVHYVLLVGDNDDAGGCFSATAVGRPFQVLKANIVLAKHSRYLKMHIFSSEDGAWGPYTKTRTPQLHGGLRRYRGRCRPLAVGNNTVHWLCLTDAASYVLKIKPQTSIVTVTTLPASFPNTIRHSYLLVTMAAAGGTPVMLVADHDKITAWAQAKRTAKWAKEPQVVAECEAILRLLQYQDGWRQSILADQNLHVHLMWFAQRSGIVLVTIDARGSFWLDLRSMKIVRSSRTLNGDANYPYEMDLASWVPTFSSAF
ncbi:hypothetical protein EJB05_10686, partial [Eragrostis curvula]